MPIKLRQLELINEYDLQALVNNQVSEQKSLEYKRDLPGNNDKDKKEFLADISSFANSSGGDLIYGIEERGGIPVRLSGLVIGNIDSEIRRLDEIILYGLEPRVQVFIREIHLKDSKTALIIRIPKSWALPHMVRYKDHCKFYSRNTKGKYRLDVSEIRAAFLFSETIYKQVRNFRIERIFQITSAETPILLDDNPKIVFHVVPLRAFEPSVKYDLTPFYDENPQPMFTDGWNRRHNFDGVLSYGPVSDSGSTNTYIQIFRNGIIEAVEASLIRIFRDQKVIPGGYEEEIIKVLNRIRLIYKKLMVDPPHIIMLSLIGVKDYRMDIDSQRLYSSPRMKNTIEKDILLIPEIIIEVDEFNPEILLKPIFDTVWNSSGWPRSMNYNEKGEWTAKW